MDSMAADIQSIISKDIRPQLQQHGGDIKFLGLNDGVVTVQLLGACASCPSNQQTVSHVIEATIQQKYPELTVQVEFSISDELINEALQILKNHRIVKKD